MLHNHPQYCCGCVHWQEVEGDSLNINDNYSLHLLVVMSIPFYINRFRIQVFQTESIAVASIILKLVFTNTSFFIISSQTNLPHLLGLSKQLQLCSQANDLQYQFQQFIIQGILILQDSNIKEHSSTKSPLNEKQTRPKQNGLRQLQTLCEQSDCSSLWSKQVNIMKIVKNAHRAKRYLVTNWATGGLSEHKRTMVSLWYIYQHSKSVNRVFVVFRIMHSWWK